MSGKPLSHTDAMGRTTSLEYDALGRRTKLTTPGGMVTTTAYTPTQTTVSTPDARVTRTTVDLLGRTVSITDNVRDGEIVADPAARTLSAHNYSADGTSTTATDQAGRDTTTVLDAFGRTVSQEGPTGLTHLKAYDDGAAHTTVAALVPDGAAQPQMSTSTSYDAADRAIQSQTTYAAGSGGTIADPVSSKAFDGLGQPTATTAERSHRDDRPFRSRRHRRQLDSGAAVNVHLPRSADVGDHDPRPGRPVHLADPAPGRRGEHRRGGGVRRRRQRGLGHRPRGSHHHLHLHLRRSAADQDRTLGNRHDPHL